MGNCCSDDSSHSEAAEALGDEIANPKVIESPSFVWRFRSGYDNVKLGPSGAAVVAEGLRARAGKQGGPISLVLPNMGLGDEGTAALAQAFATVGCRVAGLNLAGNGVSSKGAETLAAAVPNSLGLERLVVSRNPIEPPGISAIAKMCQASASISTLDLPLGSCSDVITAENDAIRSMTNCMTGNRHLTRLLLRCWGKGCDGGAIARILEAATECGDLKELFVAGQGPPEPVSVALAHGPKLSDLAARLTVLELRSVHVAPQALEAIASGLARAVACIHTLVLFACDLSDSAAQVIAAALRANRSLSTLDISANPSITDDGLGPLFRSLRHHPCLRTLNVTQLPLSVSAAQVLVEALEPPDAAPLTTARHSVIDDDRLATRLAAVLQRNELRATDSTSLDPNADLVITVPVAHSRPLSLSGDAVFSPPHGVAPNSPAQGASGAAAPPSLEGHSTEEAIRSAELAVQALDELQRSVMSTGADEPPPDESGGSFELVL
jgi:hypothetical protein